jgi:hypothetical protein
MKVFISWSGDRSRDVALALRDWLPDVINSLEPFVSSKDIYAGSRWQAEIAAQLEASNFGVICVTRENQHSPWLNFEAGALAKAVESSRVVPLAVDLKPSDIELPLAQFQAQEATEAGIFELVTSLNAACPAPLESQRLRNAVATWWPQLRAKLEAIAGETPTPAASPRPERELLEELLDTVRSLVRLSDDRFPVPPFDRARALKTTMQLIKHHEAGPGTVEIRGGNDVLVRTDGPPSRELSRAVMALWAQFNVPVRFGLMPDEGEADADEG